MRKGHATPPSRPGGPSVVRGGRGVVTQRDCSWANVAGLLLWLGGLAVVYVGLSFRFGARAGERASVTVSHRLRTELIGRVLAPEGGADDGRLPGELANTATEDARRVGAVTMALVVGVAAATGLTVGAVVLLRVSPALGLLVLLGTPLLWLVHLLSKHRWSGAARRSRSVRRGHRASRRTWWPDCASSRASAPSRRPSPATGASAATRSPPPCARHAPRRGRAGSSPCSPAHFPHEARPGSAAPRAAVMTSATSCAFRSEYASRVDALRAASRFAAAYRAMTSG